jgi:hypothetical protein
MGVPPDQLLALGRQDYVVRSVRMDTKAETWNATFSKMYLIPSGAPDSIKDFLQEGQHTAAAGGSPGTYTHSLEWLLLGFLSRRLQLSWGRHCFISAVAD